MPEPTRTTASAAGDAAGGDAQAAARFVALLADSLAARSFVKLLLGRYRGADPALADLRTIELRRVVLRGTDMLSFVKHHATRDITRNLALEAGVDAVRDALRDGFEHAHLLTETHDIQWSVSRKGRPSLRRGRLTPPAPRAGATAAAGDDARDDDAGEARLVAHDRAKRRYIDPACAFLVELGVTDSEHRVIPAMARKWKQINKFVEILDHALASSPLAAQARLRVLDLGCGKGYLTFAVHEHLTRALARQAQVVGVELRGDLVRQCNGVAQRLGLAGLCFEEGDVRHHAPGAIDIMIALHACDTATDHAIALGIRAGAAIIMCSPCCHKELRPQMRSPQVLQPLLQHGIHMAQEAEMVTDGLRALLLEAEGYTARVFEFVSPEHTSKNKMILAVKREHPASRAQTLREIAAIKAFYGVREQCLETLLDAGQCETTKVAG
ncbi:MAG TPA: SAM-dependent methyltransferase [Burkholderiaceae bacterium]|jgi:SAM-dependent methyltransferase|nr:SAM-dependent methyltransferase [Burkholderiaceae bacterium]